MTKRRRREIINQIGEKNREVGLDLMARDLYNESIYKIKAKIEQKTKSRDG